MILLLTIMLCAFIHYYFYSLASSSNSSALEKEISPSDSSEPKIMVSTTASSMQKGFKIDVYISYRGEDTGNNFVNHLYQALIYKGINTYKDDENIKQGETINGQLINATEDSKVYIIVFSKNYASSLWCLEELVKIMEFRKMAGRTVYPVFYDVSPIEVRKQIGAVGKAFAKHENEKAAWEWIEALREAGGLAGWELNNLNGNEAKIINKIVQAISLELSLINSGVDEKLVGKETQVKDVVSSIEVGFDGKLVDMETRAMDVISSLKVGIDEVRMIEIKGIRGVGKTALVRAVFDQVSGYFEAKIFVENVREVSTNLGLKKLQEQVLSDLLKEQVTVNDVTDGKNMIKESLRAKKVLLVLDDVDSVEQLEALAGEANWFKRGSRIIVTTRVEHVLASHRAVFDNVSADFEAKSFVENDNSMASSSNISSQNRFKYDVFISFRGEDTRKNFVDHLYQTLTEKGIVTYKDSEKIQKGERISNDIFKAIEDSRYYIIVFSKNYASSSWCLDELVKIMECHKMTGHTAYPVYYGVEPTEVRNQSGAVGKASAKHEKGAAARKWREALKEAAGLSGLELKTTIDGHIAKFIDKVAQMISLQLHSINSSFDEKLVGMKTRVKDVISSLEIGINEVRMIGIKGMGGSGKTTLARAVFDHICYQFESQSFVENVREVSNSTMFGLKKLQEQVLSDLLNEHVTVNGVTHGQYMMKERLHEKKVLLVLDDVDHIEQLKALGEPKWFKPGSRIIITTRDEQVLVAHRVNLIRDISLLSGEEAICLFSRFAFGRENPLQGYEELSRKVVRYASGLPLTLEVLGLFLCGKDKLEWVDAIDRLERVPLCATLENLELSYIGLEDDFKEIFLDIACILKGQRREYAIRVLECCGYHARIGLKVLEHRSLITISRDGLLGMHDHLQEMGKNIVRHLHPDTPRKHSHLWIDEEIEDILADDMGTGETRCLKLNMRKENLRILMKGLGKMKKLRYLEVDFELRYSDSRQLDESTQYFPNSLKYLKCRNYPFLYLPKTFEANNLVGLDMKHSRMVQLWEEGEKKVFKKLKFLSLSESDLTIFDFEIAPNLETLSLENSFDLAELLMPVCCRELKHLDISGSKLRTFDLGSTPNLEKLSLENCAHFVELHVPVACQNLKFLNLSNSRLRSLDLEPIPNLERLDLAGCDKLVKINAPVGCLSKVVYFKLSGCSRFTDFEVNIGSELKGVIRSSATLDLVGQSLDLCPLHPNSNLPKFQFRCSYGEDLPSSVGNIEKLISFGLCACTDLEFFSYMLCSLRCIKKLKLHYSIPEFPKDLGGLECLEELYLSSTKIKHLPDSICRLKHLKSLTVDHCDLLEKLPEDLDRLKCLEKLKVSSKKIEYLPDSICMLKRLKSLDVANCSCLGKLPEDIGLVECLEEIVITHTGISHLPHSIFGLKGLLITASPELLELYSFRDKKPKRY